ncbi:hypothetical protein SCYZ1_6 [Pseudomonas phage SCYZ1]|nr:hypothetical protein SCYZ1_6 [Pseudomonas phage SCYZ1]
MYKILYNRLMLIMLLVVALVLFAPLFIYPMLSAPDTATNVFGALLVVTLAVAIWFLFGKAVPKFCIKRG